MFKDLEISITSNNQLVCDYKRLDKAQQKKLYNVAVFSLALMDLDTITKGSIKLLDLSGWYAFGINPWLIFIPIAIAISVIFIKNISLYEELELKNVLEELWWIILALIPGLIGILLGISNFKIYI